MMQKLNVGILIFDDVEVLDFAGPFEVFSRTRITPGLESRRSDKDAPFNVFTVASKPGVITATGGLKITPAYDFATVPRIDVLVVPGGFGTRGLLKDQKTLGWIIGTSEQAQRVTSVCTGALVLAQAGLLRGKRATTHWGALDLLGELDDSVTVERVDRVVDDGVVTSAGVAAGIDMALSVVGEILGQAVADETARYIEYPRHTPR